MQTFANLWDQIETNRVVGDFYFDNPAGQSFAHPELGLPAVMGGAGPCLDHGVRGPQYGRAWPAAPTPRPAILRGVVLRPQASGRGEEIPR